MYWSYLCMCFLKVREGLEQISSFLSAHAREVVFLDFNHFYGVQNLHHEKLVAMLKEVFGEKLCPVVFAQEVLWIWRLSNYTSHQGVGLKPALRHLFQMLLSPLDWKRHIFFSCVQRLLIIVVFPALRNSDFCVLITWRCRVVVITSLIIVNFSTQSLPFTSSHACSDSSHAPLSSIFSHSTTLHLGMMVYVKNWEEGIPISYIKVINPSPKLPHYRHRHHCKVIVSCLMWGCEGEV